MSDAQALSARSRSETIAQRSVSGLCALALAGCGAALMLAGAVWYGLSRASAPGSKYVPARIDGTEITPGHMEPRR